GRIVGVAGGDGGRLFHPGRAVHRNVRRDRGVAGIRSAGIEQGDTDIALAAYPVGDIIGLRAVHMERLGGETLRGARCVPDAHSESTRVRVRVDLFDTVGRDVRLHTEPIGRQRVVPVLETAGEYL